MQEVQTWRTWAQAWRTWVLVVCLAHGLDILTTAAGLRLGIPEGNPLMAQVMLAHSEIAMYGLKVILVAGLIVAVQRLRRRYPLVWPFFQALTVLVVLTVVNNVVHIASAMRLSS